METKIDTLVIEKQKDDNSNDKDENIKTLEKRTYILERRRLGVDFCEYCDMEFMLGSEKDRKEKDAHIRANHTFECNVCDFRFQNKEAHYSSIHL